MPNQTTKTRAAAAIARGARKRREVAYTRETKLAAIAAAQLGFPTLESRGSDELDFREVAVWNLKDALERAYAAGRDAARAGLE